MFTVHFYVHDHVLFVAQKWKVKATKFEPGTDDLSSGRYLKSDC